MPSGGRAAVGAKLPERVVGEIGAALHVVDAGAEGAVALDPERQALDESHRMHRIEMAEHQDSGRVLAPRRPRHQMVAAAGMSRDALDRGRQIAIAVGDQGRQLVDLLGRFGRRLDFDPAADAVEDGGGIEGIGGCGCMSSDSSSSGSRASADRRGCWHDRLVQIAASLAASNERRPRNAIIRTSSACRALRARRSVRPVRRCCAGVWRR